MPTDFDKAVRNGAQVRAITGPNEHYGLSAGQSLRVATYKGQAIRGKVEKIAAADTKGLVSLKTEKKPGDLVEASPAKADYPRYPWGTRITLDKEPIKKLGLKLKDLEVGEKVVIVAKAEIIQLSQRQNTHSDSESIELQITEMKIV